MNVHINVNNFNTMGLDCLTHSPRNSQLQPLLLQHLVPLLFRFSESETHITNQLCYSTVVEFAFCVGTLNNYTSITFAHHSMALYLKLGVKFPVALLISHHSISYLTCSFCTFRVGAAYLGCRLLCVRIG